MVGTCDSASSDSEPETLEQKTQETETLLGSENGGANTKQAQEELFLGLVPKEYKWTAIIILLDVSTTILLCRDIFFSTCLTMLSPRLLTFLCIRISLTALLLDAAQKELMNRTCGFLLLFLLQFLAQMMYISSIIFSEHWGNYDVVSSCVISALIVSAELYVITILQCKLEERISRAKWREDMKVRGKTTALERDLEREKESSETDYLKMMTRLFAYFRPRGRIVSFCAIGVIGTKICSSFKPLVYASMLDALLNKDWELIKSKLTRYFILLTLENIFHYVMAYYQRLSRELVEKDLRKAAYKKCLSMECGYFDPLSTGEVMSTVYHHVGSVTCHLGWQLRCLLDFSVQTVMTIFIVFSLDHRLAIVACVIAPVMASGLQWFNQHCHRIRQLNRDNWTSVEKMITEAIQNIRTVKVFGCENYEFNLFSDLMDETYDTLLGEVWYCETRWTFCNFFPQLSKMMLMYYCFCLVLADEITFGEMTAFLVYQGHINWIFHSLAEQFNTVSVLLIKSHKVFKLVDRDCELLRNDLETPKACQGKVALKNVTFAYPTKKETDVLHDISLEVNPGEVIALVGHSGCGKTTIVKLMAYLYAPQKGSITLDGIPVADYSADAFSERVVSVPQEPVLFARSLHDNIAYGRTLSREDVIKAAKLANAHEFIVKQPQGYDSVVGERGITLSGGQRQRVCIARALAREPNVLLLDEATASLDSKSEHLVHKAIDNIIMGDEREMSLVIVAHRLSTVKNADRIFVIEEGRIVEVGSHSTLMNAGGAYADFVQQQILAEDDASVEDGKIVLSELLAEPTMAPKVSA